MSGFDRAKLFLTSKLHPRDLGEQATLDAFPNSLRRLNTTYLDAFLLHYPHCFGNLCAKEPQGTWRESWRALEQLHAEGRVRAIGVSNFSPQELEELIAHSKVKPHLVQSWMDPLHQVSPAPLSRSTCTRVDIVRAHPPGGRAGAAGRDPIWRDVQSHSRALHAESPTGAAAACRLPQARRAVPGLFDPGHAAPHAVQPGAQAPAARRNRQGDRQEHRAGAWFRPTGPAAGLGSRVRAAVGSVA
eukprot:2556090-Prymnesium_polylepis.1